MEINTKEALNEPVSIFLGSNKILLCGNRVRFIFGERPQAVLVTFLLINVPMTLFNSVVAVVSESFQTKLEQTLGFESNFPNDRVSLLNRKHNFIIFSFSAGPWNYTSYLRGE
jgi:hypothetical protein